MFPPFEESTILIHIPFHNSDNRIIYLQHVLSTITSYVFKSIHLIIDSNMYNNLIEGLIKKYQNITIEYKIYNNLKDPHLLTWVHRNNMIKQINNYNYFLYQEDDLEITYSSLIKWKIDSKKIYHQGYLRGFIRYEKKYRRLFSTDQIDSVHSKNIIMLNESKYFIPPNPYHGFWIYSRYQMKKFIQTKAWEDGNCKWELRERAAAGMIWDIGPKNVLIPLTDNNQIPKEVLVLLILITSIM